jgi:hypothetical protein
MGKPLCMASSVASGMSDMAESHLGKTTNSSRKAASAQIAKIPFLLASHIARVFRP